MTESRVAIVLGAGDGIGSAVGRRFAREGYATLLVRRDPAKSAQVVEEIAASGGAAVALGVDVRQEDAVQDLFACAERDFGPVEVCVYNAASNVKLPLRETDAKLFYKVWKLACFGGFLAAREAARYMVPRGKGTILFTGATASVRGGDGFAAFASAKAALRTVAQSAARELGKEGVHVAHVVIDAGVDSAVTHERYRRLRGIDPDTLPPDSLTRPDSIADTYWALHAQPRDAWTHELDLRPYVEPW